MNLPSYLRISVLVPILFGGIVLAAQAGYNPCGDLGCEPPPPPTNPIVELTANPESVSTATAQSSLSWSGTNVTSCTSSDFSTGGAVYGTVSVTPGTTRTYSISCTGTGGSTSDSVTVSVVPKPDLVVGSPYAESGAVAGRPIELTAMYGNIGNAPTGSHLYYRFNVTGPASTGVNGYRATSMTAGEDSVATETLTLNTPGTYNLYFCVDATNNISELSEGNNCSGPVTVTVSPETCISGFVGMEGNYTEYLGSCEAAYQCADDIDNDNDNTGDYDGIPGGSTQGPECGPGIIINEGPYNGGGVDGNGGYYYWPECVLPAMPPDPSCSGPEDPLEDETQPDLTASGITPIVAEAGTAVTLSSTITNNTSIATGAGFPNFLVITSAPGGTGTTLVSENPTVGALGGLGGAVVSRAYTFATPGAYSMRVCADYTSAWASTITESNEANNCGPWTSITVSPESTQCSDGADNDGDGYYDTADPGCTSGSDDDESPVNPPAASCTDPEGELTVAPNRVRADTATSVEFTYEASGVTSCTVSGPDVSNPLTANACVVPSGVFDASISIDTQALYTLVCDGVTVDTAIVNVIPQFEEF